MISNNLGQKAFEMTQGQMGFTQTSQMQNTSNSQYNFSNVKVIDVFNFF